MNALTQALKKDDKKAEEAFVGEYRVLNTAGNVIRKEGEVYFPKDEDEVACLEYQVKQGRVSKKAIKKQEDKKE